MDLSGMKLVNLAFRVPSVGALDELLDGSGFAKRAVHAIDGEAFLEASFGDVRINFFETPLYEAKTESPTSGFLHMSFVVPDLDVVLADERWRSKLIWGPAVIKGGFGHRRIAFFESIPGCRIELMETLDD
jgi:hypothetical protein